PRGLLHLHGALVAAHPQQRDEGEEQRPRGHPVHYGVVLGPGWNFCYDAAWLSQRTRGSARPSQVCTTRNRWPGSALARAFASWMARAGVTASGISRVTRTSGRPGPGWVLCTMARPGTRRWYQE